MIGYSIHEALKNSFKDLYQIPCWSVTQGFGSYLTFEFGEPRLEIIEAKKECKKGFYSKRRASVLGTWRLWITDCFWELSTDGRCVHSESSREDISAALHGLCGEALQQVLIDDKKGTSEFLFDFGSILRTRPNPGADSDGRLFDSWTLFEPTGHQFVFRSDGRYSHGPDGEDEFV